MKLKDKLNRMQRHMSSNPSKEQTDNTVAQTEEDTGSCLVPYEKEWEKLQAKPLFLDDQYVIKRQVSYPLDYHHGKRTLGELFQVWERWERELSSHPLRPQCRPEDILFFDTETTGLNSGAGNMIYLLGGAYVTRDEVQVVQYFLPGPESEVAFYYYFLQEMNISIHHLATFNGKAFDWPQLQTRYTFVRNEVPKLPDFGQIDLLHASRRLFKHTLSSCRLSVVEEEVLGVQRENDTPGYLAPMLYFDYLHEQNPAFIEGILAHNEWDVLSLVVLYTELSDRVLGRGTTARETFEIGRWFEYLRHWPQAEWCYKEAAGVEETNAEYTYALAAVLKKQQRIEEALPYFESVFQAGKRFAFEAAIELAKYMEHKQKDIEKAAQYTEEAALLDYPGADSELQKRRQRLQQKRSRGK